jgi:hypothetical protein
MNALYGAQTTYINNVKSLSATELQNKLDIFYLNLMDSPEIFSLNMISNENEEFTVDVTFFVDEAIDPQDYANGKIAQIIADALHSASLNVKPKVAARIEEPVGV